MCEQKENCFYYLSLTFAPRLRELVAAGRIKIEGLRFCDNKVPIIESLIPPEGTDLNCYGPDSDSCPGFVHK